MPSLKMSSADRRHFTECHKSCVWMVQNCNGEIYAAAEHIQLGIELLLKHFSTEEKPAPKPKQSA